MAKASYLAALLSLSFGIAGADDFTPPPMKDGLWETHIAQTKGGRKEPENSPVQMCQAKDFAKSALADAKEMRKNDECTSSVTKTSPNSFKEETQCKKGANAGNVIKASYSYQGDSASHTEMHFGEGASETIVIMDSKWLGNCPAGMKPGDIMMNGKIIPGGN
jgi:hypothetical protein